MSLAETLRHQWRARPAGERYRLLGGGLVILAMALYLIMDRGLLPTLPDTLGEETPVVSPSAWEKEAKRLGIREARIEAAGGERRLAGTLETPADFTAFADWAATRDWWARDWSLIRRDGQMVLEARFIRGAP